MPLFIAQVDPDRLCVMRQTERILVPQRGARLGNFGVTAVSDQETWVTVAEWMHPAGCETYGSDNSVYLARLLWKQATAPVRMRATCRRQSGRGHSRRPRPVGSG